MMGQKFYEYSQNNSGGHFDVDENVCHRLFIEADNYEDAESKAQDLGVYFNGCQTGDDCPCCGDRWYAGDVVDFGVHKSIEDYAQWLANEHGWTEPDGRIFYKDGTIKEVYKEKTK